MNFVLLLLSTFAMLMAGSVEAHDEIDRWLNQGAAEPSKAWKDDISAKYEPENMIKQLVSSIEVFGPLVVPRPPAQLDPNYLNLVIFLDSNALNPTPAKQGQLAWRNTRIHLASAEYCDARATLRPKPKFQARDGSFLPNVADPLRGLPRCLSIPTTQEMTRLIDTVKTLAPPEKAIEDLRAEVRDLQEILRKHRLK